MTPVADAAGFIDAQANLRSMLGEPVTFKVPVAKVWPGGTKINPDTGLPYDSTIKQTSAEFTDVVKVCLLIYKRGSPLRPQGDTAVAASGEMSGMDMIIDLAADDKPDVEDAAEVTVQGLDYRVDEMKPFSLAGTSYRWLVYGKQL